VTRAVQGMEAAGQAGRREGGFSLLELLLALSLLAVITVVTWMAFSTVAGAWQRGTDMADKLHHGDFVVEQLVMALRSAYYPSTGVNGDYGMRAEDNGDGEGAADELSWVKLGTSLVGRDPAHAGGPHRVWVALGETEDGDTALGVRSWGLLSEVEDFEPEDLEPVFLSDKIRGLNVRFQDPEHDPQEDGKIEWIDEWEDTNRIPLAVELSVYMEPLGKNEDPIEIKRVVELPCAPLAWAQGDGTVAPPETVVEPGPDATPGTGNPPGAAPVATPSPGTPENPGGTPPSLPPGLPPGGPPGGPPNFTPPPPPSFNPGAPP
jgi:prepilin-type N-terminal cleavage/methylation domain-containing protein